MNNWFEVLPGIHAHLWERLRAGVADRTAPARHVVFATVGIDGWPEARTVVLRGADPLEGVLEVHTDLHSCKMASLAALPRAALHIWDEGENLQIRLQSTVTVSSGSDAADVWSRVPDHSRQSYGVIPPPGRSIADALAYTKAPDPATFAILRCRIETIDAVYLGAQHRRARFDRTDEWAGHWLSP